MTSLVHELKAALGPLRVSFDLDLPSYLSPVPHFDYGGIAAAADYIVIMAYSAASLDQPMTHASGGMDLTTLDTGLTNLLHHFAIPREKIVVAFGWYGVDFVRATQFNFLLCCLIFDNQPLPLCGKSTAVL